MREREINIIERFPLNLNVWLLRRKIITMNKKGAASGM